MTRDGVRQAVEEDHVRSRPDQRFLSGGWRDPRRPSGNLATFVAAVGAPGFSRLRLLSAQERMVTHGATAHRDAKGIWSDFQPFHVIGLPGGKRATTQLYPVADQSTRRPKEKANETVPSGGGERRKGPDRRTRWEDRRGSTRPHEGGARQLAPFPTTQSAVRRWVRHELRLPPEHEQALLDGIDALVVRQEQLWERSKADAISALTAAFRNRLDLLQRELSAREATVSNITEYFEQLISELAVRATHDPKTHLLHFTRFREQLEYYLRHEQRGSWCAVGLADISSFKWYNDTLGHAVGDRIIESVARLLQEHVRSTDILAHESTPDTHLHARFGGDEFCFLVPNLDDPAMAAAIADRFGQAVRQYDWSAIDERLTARPVTVDVGVACLRLGPLGGRRFVGEQLVRELMALADTLMYQAKKDRATRPYTMKLLLDGDRLTEITDETDA